jgi:hypothetical protein
MPENREFKRLARRAAAERGEPYAAAADRLRGEPAYVPGYGFRPALAGFQSSAPASAEGAAGVATVMRVLGSADRTEVDVDLATAAEPRPDAPLRPPAVHAELVAGRWSGTAGPMSFNRGGNRVRMLLTFPAVPHRVRAGTLRLSGGLGTWEVRVPVKPLGGVARRPQPAGAGPVTRHGVTLAVAGVVFDRDRTVIRILASSAEPIRFVRGLGTGLGSRRPPGQELVLVDDLGRAYRENTDEGARPDPRGREHVVVFPPVDSAAHTFRLEVPAVGAEERGDGVEVDVPVQPAVIRLGRYRLQLLGSEPATGPNAHWYPLRIRFRWVSPPTTRRPLGPGQAFVDGRGAGFSFPRQDDDYLDVQVANPPARRIRLAFPRVLLGGPWRLVFIRQPEVERPT